MIDCVATDVWHNSTAGLMGKTEPACTSIGSRCRGELFMVLINSVLRHGRREDIPRGENLICLLYKQQCYSRKKLAAKFELCELLTEEGATRPLNTWSL